MNAVMPIHTYLSLGVCTFLSERIKGLRALMVCGRCIPWLYLLDNITRYGHLSISSTCTICKRALQRCVS
jgi:hypothetical protein